MINSFYGFEMGRRALNYFRRGFDTSGHNISNATTEGFSRQRVEASSTYPFTNPAWNRPALPGQIGTGVKIDAIVRLRDEFLDLQFRQESTVKGYWDLTTEVLNTLETFVNEPHGESVKVGLDEFWAAVQELSKRPDSSSARENLVAKAGTLATYLDSLARNYEEYRTDLNGRISLTVDEANTIIDQITALNITIRQAEGIGDNPNDLYDRRDLLAEKLSTLIDAEVSAPSDMLDGEYKVYLNGRIIIQGDKCRHLEKVSVPGNQGFLDVQVEENTFDHVSNTNILTALVGQHAEKAVHAVAVERLANFTTWKVGGAPINGSIGRLPISDPDRNMEITGSLRLQVGTSGVKATGAQLDNKAGSPKLLNGAPSGDDPKDYIFRIATQDFQFLPGSPNELYVKVEWDGDSWNMSSRAGAGTIGAPKDLGSDVTLQELRDYLADDTGVGKLLTFSIESSGANGIDRLVVSSEEHHLISFNDIKGDFIGGKVGLKNDSPEVVVEIEDGDSLRTVANKINSVYRQKEGGPSDPSQWLHASIAEEKGDYYLTLESDLLGEAYRINVMGSDKGDTYAARRLGLMSGDPDDFQSKIISTSTDSLIMVDNVRYLSNARDFRQARRISADDGYKASTLEDVTKGIVYHLKGVGTAAVQVDHHIRGGELKALMEARDDVVLSHLESFDDVAYGIISEMNAVHYSGHGTGVYSDITGTAFFNPVGLPNGAARSMAVNPSVRMASGLLAAAMGNGRGKTKGEGNGDNAIAMAQLKQAKVMAGDTATFNEYYEDFIANLGVESERAQAMQANQTSLVNQIESQRQEVMGVNIDEEMMMIQQFQHSFDAMSRYITTLDDMLDKLINGTGRVGL